MKAKTSTLLVLLALAPAVTAQESVQEKAQMAQTTLQRAKAVFTKTDGNADKKVTLREAQAAGHSLAEFRTFDADGDSVITQDEFLVGYADRLTARGGRLAKDYSDEVARLRNRRQNRRESANGTDDARRSDGLREKVRTGDVSADRAEAMLDKAKSSSANNTATARGRASSALSKLRESKAARTEKNVALENNPAAESVANGPAARRVTGKPQASTTDLRQILQDRKQKNAQSSRQDPRAKEARSRAQEKLQERASGKSRGVQRGGNTGSRAGNGRGPSAGRSRTTGGASRGGRGR